MNKKIIAVGILSMFLLTSFSVFGSAENSKGHDQITKTYYFNTPYVNQVTINGEVYDQVEISDSSGGGNPGEPNLPTRGANILLPQGAMITDIEILQGEKIYLGSGFNIEPVQEPVKLSDARSFSIPIQNELIYTSDEVFPESLFSLIGTYGFRGYEILVLTLNPVQYIPASGELYYFKDMTVSVKTVEDNQINPLFRKFEKDEIEVINKVDNPSYINTYIEQPAQPLSLNNYDLLILTTDEFENDFEPLKNAHNTRGITTEIKTLSDIRLFPDKVTTEDIRDFIRDEYIENGIEYVLLGGDSDFIHAKDLWVRAWYGGDSTLMPSDLYYACLDGPYNYDEDDLWGEPDDGENGEDVDLIAEVYIGRACVDNSAEVDNFIGKTIEYIEYGGYSSGKVLMVGEHLWENPDTWGGDYMDELIDGCNNSGYTTVGVPSGQYDIDTLYDLDWPGNNWPKSEIISRINNGALIVNHMGHSSYGYCMKMINEDVYNLTYNDPCFIYSQGCMAGGFDNPHDYDCIAEYFTIKTNLAAFAVIMNARYGWGVSGGTDGPSQRFHREFLDAIFGEEITEIGKANQDSKEDNLYRVQKSCMRWCYYQLNLFGDPTLSFYNSVNNPPNKPDQPSGLSSGAPGVEYEYKTRTTDVDENQVYYKWSWGDGTFSEWLGPYNSGEIVSVIHSWPETGRYKIKVKARDVYKDESDWSDPLSVTMPRTKVLYNTFFLRFLERFKLLERLLNL